MQNPTTGIYLITGFLGAGKTTFLKNFIKLNSSKKMRIIINEFGKEGIDGKLLSELNVIIDEINNGSIFCSCRLEQFENALQNALSDSPELIIIEASGLSDPTNIRKILSDENKFMNVSLLGSICIVDAINLKKVISTARICKKQLSVSDLVIINKTDIASKEDIELTQKLIFELYPNIKTRLTRFGEINPKWLESLNASSHEASPLIQGKELGLQKALIKFKDNLNLFTLNKLLSMIIEDSYRIKGFVEIENKIYLISCVCSQISIEEYSGNIGDCGINTVVVLAGAAMAMEKSLKTMLEWYGEYIISIE